MSSGWRADMDGKVSPNWGSATWESTTLVVATTAAVKRVLLQKQWSCALLLLLLPHFVFFTLGCSGSISINSRAKKVVGGMGTHQHWQPLPGSRRTHLILFNSAHYRRSRRLKQCTSAATWTMFKDGATQGVPFALPSSNAINHAARKVGALQPFSLLLLIDNKPVVKGRQEEEKKTSNRFISVILNLIPVIRSNFYCKMASRIELGCHRYI